MSLETELRESLHSAASTVTPSSDSWWEIQRQLDSPSGRRRSRRLLVLAGAALATVVIGVAALVGFDSDQEEMVDVATNDPSDLPVAPRDETSAFDDWVPDDADTPSTYLLDKVELAGETHRIRLVDVGRHEPPTIAVNDEGGASFDIVQTDSILVGFEHAEDSAGMDHLIYFGTAVPDTRTVRITRFDDTTTTATAYAVPGYNRPDGRPVAFFAAVLDDAGTGAIIEALDQDGTTVVRTGIVLAAGDDPDRISLGPTGLYPRGTITPYSAYLVAHHPEQGLIVLDGFVRDHNTNCRAPVARPAHPDIGVEVPANAALVDTCTGFSYDLAGRCLTGCVTDLNRVDFSIDGDIRAETIERPDECETETETQTEITVQSETSDHGVGVGLLGVGGTIEASC